MGILPRPNPPDMPPKRTKKVRLRINISERLTDKLQTLQNRAARVISGADYLTPINEYLSKLGWSNLKESSLLDSR